MIESFRADVMLGRLKDFQRRTVDYVFRRLYTDADRVGRFLVADEVGLGKTLVARGVIARAVEHLRDTGVKRIDVVYVCSNAAIARQNINRLNVIGGSEFAMASRLTLLPRHVKDLAGRQVNFVSFTPGTTFDLKSRGGVIEERAVIYRLLEGEPWLDREGLFRALRATAGWPNWTWWARSWSEPLDPSLGRSFREALQRNDALRGRVAELCERFARRDDDGEAQLACIGALRMALTHVCVEALQPDLVILDEFQRFKDLLHGADEAAELARALFDYRDARVLLLSATPYKMLTLDHEEADDHYPDFIRTMSFLEGDESLQPLERAIQDYRRALYALPGGRPEELERTRDALQTRLRRVMVRTERVGMTARQDAMVGEPPRPAPLRDRDLYQAEVADMAARAVDARDVIEYWKSSPYLLSFLRDYDLRRRIDKKLGSPPQALVDAVRMGAKRRALLQRKRFEAYEAIEAANARMRVLFEDTLDRQMWRLLWLPPSLPYTKPAGAYADAGAVTKSLVFSAWNAVPEAIAVLCSYEAERRMLGHLRVGYSKLHTALKQRLRFTKGRDGRLTGMPALALMYPSPSLASLVDPLVLALELGRGSPAPLKRVVERTERVLAEALRGLGARWQPKDPVDRRWYWAAPAMLDARHHPDVLHWYQAEGGWRSVEARDEDDAPKGFAEHVALLAAVADGREPLGRPPADLAHVLADLALAGPGVCALRALHRVACGSRFDDASLLTAAARIGEGFRTLYNVPETMGLLGRAGRDDGYWRAVLKYGVEGNLQAVLDEQAHVLVESLGLQDQSPEERVRGVAGEIAEAMSIRTSQLRVEELRAKSPTGPIELDHFAARCRFALRFGDLKDAGRDQTLHRAETVRKAFNSPFRPFVLASTSVGQEGLDFHTWCHAVVHWNLPSNPVDLEQREGRVHRYKGHAVRKNVAARFGLSTLARRWDRRGDPWTSLFEAAAEGRGPEVSDLVPYWLYEIDGGAQIERRVPVLPFSREKARLAQLKRSLVLYRLVFGQPRQQDLLQHLSDRLTDEEAAQTAALWRIALGPPDRSTPA